MVLTTTQSTYSTRNTKIGAKIFTDFGQKNLKILTSILDHAEPPVYHPLLLIRFPSPLFPFPSHFRSFGPFHHQSTIPYWLSYVSPLLLPFPAFPSPGPLSLSLPSPGSQDSSGCPVGPPSPRRTAHGEKSQKKYGEKSHPSRKQRLAVKLKRA